MIDSRTISIAVAAALVALTVGFVIGRATMTPPPAPVTVAERPSIVDAKVRNDEKTFEKSQVVGLTARLGGGLVSWNTVRTPNEQPAAFHRLIRESRQSCRLRVHPVGVECSEPPCIGLLRQMEGDAVAGLSACATWTKVYPTGTRFDVGEVPCPNGRSDVAVLVSPPARADLPADALAAEEARLATRRAAIRAGWSCPVTVQDVAH